MVFSKIGPILKFDPMLVDILHCVTYTGVTRVTVFEVVLF